MSEVVSIDANKTAPRTVEVVRNEYMKLCAEVGNLEYMIKCHQTTLQEKYTQMNELNKEAAATGTEVKEEVKSAGN